MSEPIWNKFLTERDKAVFGTSGYAARQGFGKRPALIIIDVNYARGQERCLYAFPRTEFEQIHAQLRQAPLTSKQARDYMRVFLSGATDEVPDRQGRVTIPQILRTYAGLDRDLAVIGSGSKVEIWDAGAWATYLDAQEDSYAQITEEVVPGL